MTCLYIPGRKPDFYHVHRTIQSPTTNLDRVLDEWNDYPRISPTIRWYMSPEKKPTS
jgi:hypothetical protein